ncbi:MAG: hypothetical protein EXS08_07180 [Planctomycetes bacterium]|nr:hypothetical protein [Planctomycetota bacterium]
MSRLARILTLVVATLSTVVATMVALELVLRLREAPQSSIRLQDLVESPCAGFAVPFGFAVGAPLALGLLWPTDLRRSIPFVALTILATALLVAWLAEPLLGRLRWPRRRRGAMLWCNHRATAGVRPTLDGSGRSAENARPSNP